MTTVNAQNLVDIITVYLGQARDEQGRYLVAHLQSFQSVGIASRHKGIVLTMPDGSEYQLEINQTRQAR